MTKIFIAGAVAALIPAAAFAQSSGSDPAPGASALMQANFATAEREIRASAAQDTAASNINLAIIYAQTGRTAQAEELFRKVAMMDDVTVVIADGSSASSHEIAKRGLREIRSSRR